MTRSRPHFLHVGAEKTGTSWFYRTLGQHPDVHLSPVKEVRYFFEAHAYPWEGLLERLAKGDWHNRDYRDYLRRRLKLYLRHPYSAAKSIDRIRWDYNFLFGRRSDEWFENLFRCEDSKVTGDFSPQTCRIPPHRIMRISQEWPATKVLLALRDPVAWSWSFARMSLIKDRELADISDREFHDFFRTYATNYPGASKVSEWESSFPGRFQLIFFDEIAADPGRLLHGVCEFLGLTTAPIAGFRDISQSRNPGRPLSTPDRFRAILIDLYRDEVSELAARYGSYPQQWLEGYGKGPVAAERR